MRRAAALVASLILSACAGSPPPLLVQPYLEPGQAQVTPVPLGPIFAAPAPMSDDRRWLAMAHVELRPALAAGLFDCALGARLSGAKTPTLTRIFARLQRDLDIAGRDRDALGARAEPCTRPAWTLVQAWPGRSPALGIAYAEVLSRLAPDRSARIKATGRAIAESAVLCGLSSAEEAGSALVLSLAVVDSAAQTPAFAQDLLRAQAEIDAVRASGLTSPACAAERRALGQ